MPKEMPEEKPMHKKTRDTGLEIRGALPGEAFAEPDQG
jgi:hypothetical protein